MTDEKTAGERIVAALDALGIETAHFGFGGLPADMLSLLSFQPHRVSGIAAVVPAAAPPQLLGHRPLVAVASRAGDRFAVAAGREFDTAVPVQWLPDRYEYQIWSDVAADNNELVCRSLRAVDEARALPAVRIRQGELEVEGVRVRVEGSGPPLVLLPAALWPTQWDSAVTPLAREFTVIRMSGGYLGSLASFEQRARAEGSGMVDGLFDRLQIRDGETVLEVGTGSGVLARQLASRTSPATRIIGLDLNHSFLYDAGAMAATLGLEGRIEWREASALELPFSDGSIDVVFSVTALEECDADKALEEMHRVLRPGGRAGVIVRATDRPFFWGGVEVPDDLRPQLEDKWSGVSPEGCADRSLYGRFARHFGSLRPYLHHATIHPPLAAFVEANLEGLDPARRPEFRDAVARAMAEGTAFSAAPLHCIVGTKS